MRSRPITLVSLGLSLLAPCAAHAGEPAAAPNAPRPLVVAEPAPPSSPPPARVAVAPPPPPPAPPPAPRRWYGWQALIVHGLTDTLLTSSIVVAEVNQDAALGLWIGALCARPLGSFVVQAAHDGEYLLAPLGNFLVPAMGAAGGLGIAEEVGIEEGDPAWLQALAGGMIVGGSVMAALEASFAFEDAPVKAAIGPGTVTVTGRF